MSDDLLLLNPLWLLRLEGVGLCAVSVAGYATLDGSWWIFAACFFLADLAMLGYLAGRRVGAACYNLAHTTISPVVLLLVAAWLRDANLASLALIWSAHIGFDRAAGYGLKYRTSFHHTHLQPDRPPHP